MDSTEKVFAYGTLRDPNVQQKVIGKKIAGTPDRLEGCIKSHFEHGDRKTHPVILCPIEGHGVDGLTLAVTPEDLQKMDTYQSDIYRRQKVTLKSGVSAWTYVK
jgi:hypothetical protein